MGIGTVCLYLQTVIVLCRSRFLIVVDSSNCLQDITVDDKCRYNVILI